MKAIAYIRWSSDEQTSGDSLERQTANVQAYCQRAGLDLVETLVDSGLSAHKGEHLQRGQLGALLVGRIDSGLCSGMALVVEDMDRLSRQGIIKAGELIERIGKGNVTIHIAKDGQIIRPGSNNNLDTAIRNVVNAYNAEDYSKKLRERVTSAWRNKRKNAKDGEAITKNLPAWLKTDGAGSAIQIDEAKAEVVREMFRLAASGSGKRAIVRIMTERGVPPITGGKKWDATYVGRILTSRAVLGERVSLLASRNQNDGETRLKYYPAIVDAELWQAAQAAISARTIKTADGKTTGKFQGRTGRVVNLFKGLVADITTGESVPMYLFYQSKGRAIRLSTEKRSSDDTPRWIRLDYFERNFLAFIGDLDFHSILGEAESAELREARTNAANLKLAIEQETARVEKIADALIDAAKSPTLTRRLAEAETKLATLEDELPAAEAWQVELEARHAALLDDSIAFAKLAGATDTATRMQLQAEIRRKVKSITFNFRGHLLDAPEFNFRVRWLDPEFPAGECVMAWIEFINGAKRILAFTTDCVRAVWIHEKDEVPAGPPEAWRKKYQP
jgi:DNA invertase Pin-like site-specific DNA recombinase